MNKFSTIFNIALIINLIVFLSGCQEVIAPQNIDPKILQSESKWLTNSISKEKIYKVLYKEFDKNGKLLINEEYSELGSIKTRSLYTYLESQSLEEVLQYSDSGTVLLTNKNEYTYDLKGRVSKKVSYENSGSIKSVQTFNYDINGNLIKKVEVNSQSGASMQTDITYGYNNTGELISRTTVFEGATQSRDSLVYSPSNHTLEIISFSTSGNINITNSYTYDNQGRIIEETSKGNDGSIIKRYIYEYTFFK